MNHTHFGKRTAALLMTVFLLLQALTAAAGNTSAVISAQRVDAAAGEDVHVFLRVEGNPGMSSLKLKIAYDDSVLTLRSVSDKSLFDSAPTTSPQLTKNPYIILWASAGNMLQNGELVELVFHVSDSAVSGLQTIAVTVESAFNETDGKVAISAQNAEIMIGKTPPATIQDVKTGDQITANVQCKKGISALALCAQYDAFGRLLSVQTAALKAGETNLLTFSAADDARAVKLFVVDPVSFFPLCTAAVKRI